MIPRPKAAEAVGLNPDSAAYTKSKLRVRAYMLEHRAAVQQQLVHHEAQELRRLSLDREKVLDRLWEIANLSPEMTRGSITGQVKALSMIIAMENSSPTVAPALRRRNPPLRPPTRKSMPRHARPGLPWGVPGSRPHPSTRSQALPLSSRKMGLPAPPVPPVTARKHRRFMSPCLLLFQTWEFPSL
jgi:hypothetical protein